MSKKIVICILAFLCVFMIPVPIYFNGTGQKAESEVYQKRSGKA